MLEGGNCRYSDLWIKAENSYRFINQFFIIIKNTDFNYISKYTTSILKFVEDFQKYQYKAFQFLENQKMLKLVSNCGQWTYQIFLLLPFGISHSFESYWISIWRKFGLVQQTLSSQNRSNKVKADWINYNQSNLSEHLPWYFLL